MFFKIISLSYSKFIGIQQVEFNKSILVLIQKKSLYPEHF
jgi:hypothetical protein